MAVKIRLKRLGRRNRPYYRICVFDGKTRRDGRPIEELGTYDASAETLEEKVVVDAARAQHWLKVGAQPSETVNSIFRRMGIKKDGPLPEVAAPEGEAATTEPVATAEPAATADTEN